MFGSSLSPETNSLSLRVSYDFVPASKDLVFEMPGSMGNATDFLTITKVPSR